MGVGNPTYSAGEYDIGRGMVSGSLFLLGSTKLLILPFDDQITCAFEILKP